MKRIDQLENLLKKKPRTAKEVARLLACSKPWAHRLIRRVAAYSTVKTLLNSSGKTGPNPTMYFIKG